MGGFWHRLDDALVADPAAAVGEGVGVDDLAPPTRPGQPDLVAQVWPPGEVHDAGRWREVINTDAFAYGGSGVGNQGFIEAVPEPSHGQPASAVFAVPPLGALWLVPDD